MTKVEIQKAKENDKETLYKIGIAYYDKEDYSKAHKWLLKSALDGYYPAQHKLGDMYYYGSGVSKDAKKGVEWYTKAAENGDQVAMNLIAHVYHKGLGISSDIDTAIKWYTRAANHGNLKTLCSLGLIYETEDQVKDLQKAIHWYQMAAGNNIKEGKMAAERLKERGFYVDDQLKSSVVLYIYIYMMNRCLICLKR